MSAELAESPSTNPLSQIREMIAQGVSPEQLGKIIEIHQQWVRNRAAEAFGAAVTEFQRLCPVIRKQREVKDRSGKDMYNFASYDDIMYVAGPLLTRCGLAIRFDTEPAAGGMRIICRVRHGIHYEDTGFTLPVPPGVMNDTQKMGAALKYGQRYALCAALNIVTTDRDDDTAQCLDAISPEQVGRLNDLIVERGADLFRFLAWAEIESLDRMPVGQYSKAMDMLARKRKAGAS